MAGRGWLIVLALTSQVIGWLLITTSLPRLPAAITSLTLTVQPVGSVALAALILGEAPTALQLVGVAIVLVAVITATAPGAERPTETGPPTPAGSAPPPRARPRR